MLFGELGDVAAPFALGGRSLPPSAPAELEVERALRRDVASKPSKPPRIRIAASSVSCGARPIFTSLGPGGVPLL